MSCVLNVGSIALVSHCLVAVKILHPERADASGDLGIRGGQSGLHNAQVSGRYAHWRVTAFESGALGSWLSKEDRRVPSTLKLQSHPCELSVTLLTYEHELCVYVWLPFASYWIPPSNKRPKTYARPWPVLSDAHLYSAFIGHRL